MNFKKLKTAITFLTCITFLDKDESSNEGLGKSTALFPIVGFLIGFILVIINYLLSKILPYSIVNALLVLTMIIITRGIHIDGLCDVIDGFFGAYTKNDRIKIMKDSSVGVFSICGIFFLLLLKFISINNLSVHVKYLILFVMPVLGRFSIVFISFISTYIEGSIGIGKTFVENTGEREFWFAAISAILISFLFMTSKGILILIFVIAFSIIFERFSKKKIGGINGDVLGASCEISEALTLILANIFDGTISLQLFDGTWI